jgi:hypothetical protein
MPVLPAATIAVLKNLSSASSDSTCREKESENEGDKKTPRLTLVGMLPTYRRRAWRSWLGFTIELLMGSDNRRGARAATSPTVIPSNPAGAWSHLDALEPCELASCSCAAFFRLRTRSLARSTSCPSVSAA